MKIQHNPDLKISITGIVLLSALAGLLILLFNSVILLYALSTPALLTERGGIMYKVDIYAVIGDAVIISAKSEPSKDKAAALLLDAVPDFTYYNSSDIQQIEFIDQPSAPAADRESGSSSVSDVVGRYDVNVSGHQGTLVIAEKDGYYYGYIRFPQWAKGVKEPLKKVYVRGNRISFVRSVENAAEQKRVGAPSLFTQKFDGDILNGGKKIKGFFLNHGAKEMWEADRM